MALELILPYLVVGFILKLGNSVFHEVKELDVYQMSPVPDFQPGTLKRPKQFTTGPEAILSQSGQGSETLPQHGVLFGMTGAGKSVIVADLLAQTGHRFGLRLIVEECARRFMSGHLLGVLERPSFSS